MVGGLSLRYRALMAIGATVVVGLFAHGPAKAADLGGDCCADLEERVAELEATTVRKGNKKVSITLYGQVNKAVLFWDDGAEKNTYTVDNNYESSRFGLKGSAKIGGDWSAGYRLEVEITRANSAKLNQFNDDNANDPLGSMNVRHSYVYLNDKNYGEMRLGLTATPIYNITKDTNVSDLEDSMHSDDRMMQSFLLRPTGFNNAEGLSKLKWSDISRCYSSSNDFVCSTRREGVAYWSPTWEGFSASVGWFDDGFNGVPNLQANQIWGAALRYKKEWFDTFEVGAGVGYENFRNNNLLTGSVPTPADPKATTLFERDIQEWAGSASIKHTPTGLFAFTAFSFSDQGDSDTVHAGVFTGTSAPLMSAWDAQLGIQRKMPWFGLATLGDTSFWGGFTDILNGIGAGLGGIPASRFLKAGTFANVDVNTEITGAEVNRWSLGLDQALDSANMHLYAVYQHFTPDVSLVDSSLKHVSAPLDDFQLFYTGGRIYF
jgi:predicted porin